MTDRHARASLLLLSAICLGSIACGEANETNPSGEPETGRLTRTIVAGARERGYPAVGALVRWRPDRDPTGSFCTGTLISPRWVLTAAHCVDELADADPHYVHFLVGDSAREPEEAQLLPVDQIVVHPAYFARGGSRAHDIALMSLVEPAPADVTPISIYRSDLSDDVGSPLLYVGFGIDDPEEGAGGGIKRSVTLRLFSVEPTAYVTTQDGGGVCFGDSGGPGLLGEPGAHQVVGVNSTVVGTPTCRQYSTQIRVDAFRSWIDATTGAPFTDCRTDPTVCQCEAACRPDDGVCDNAACGLQRCSQVLDCFTFCLGSTVCQVSCLLRATNEASFLLDRFLGCTQSSCPGNVTPACVDEFCWRQDYACSEGLAAVTSTASCGQVLRCSDRCAPADRDCLDACFYEGTLTAQQRFLAADACIEGCPADAASCGLACRQPLLTCMPNETCRLAGGDCGPGTACRASAWGATYCLPTEGREVGQACESSSAACADGALCLASPDGPRCRELCATAADCEQSAPRCMTTRVEGLPVGVCDLPCPDADDDGACDDADCAPDDPAINPSAAEVCDADAVDEDCSGAANEGCDPCQFGGPDCPPDGGLQPTGATDRGDAGCGCSAARGRLARSTVAWSLAGLLLVVAWRRRDCLVVVLTAGLMASACEGGALDEPQPGPDAGHADGGSAPPADGGHVDAGEPVPTTIYDLQQGLAGIGYPVTLQQVIVASPVVEAGFFLSDGTSQTYSGIFVTHTASPAATLGLTMGDVVDLTGVVVERGFDAGETGATATRTELQLLAPADVEVTGAAEVPPPIAIGPTVLAIDELAEPFEGVLVTLDGGGTVTERDAVTETLTLDGIVAIGALFERRDFAWVEPGLRFEAVTGLVQFGPTGFELLPRRGDDLAAAPRDLRDCLPVDGFLACTDRVNWNTARRECARRGGRLLLAKTPEINALASAGAWPFADRSTWIGASDIDDEGVWRWTDGSTVTFSNWAPNEPNNCCGGQDCAVTNFREQSAWDDSGCNARHPFICEFRAPLPRCIDDSDCAGAVATCIDGSCRP